MATKKKAKKASPKPDLDILVIVGDDCDDDTLVLQSGEAPEGRIPTIRTRVVTVCGCPREIAAMLGKRSWHKV